MKILYIGSFYGAGGGGAALMLQNMAELLANRGESVTVLTLTDRSGRGPEVIRGVKVCWLSPWNLYNLASSKRQPAWKKMLWQLVDLYNPHAYRILVEVLRREAPDIVHIQKMRGFSAAVWRAATESCPGRVIQTCHDFESFSPVGTLRGTVGTWARQKHWLIRPYIALRARLSRDISVVTAPSLFTLDSVRSAGLFPLARATVIPDAHEWSREALASIRASARSPSGQSAEVKLLYLGRIEPEKGVRELCSALEQVAEYCPNLKLLVAGDGSIRRELELVHGSNPKIQFLGTITGVQKENTLSAVDGIVVPSTWDEVFGIVNVEAFAFGKPVIAARAGGIPELVRDGETGWLVEPGSIADLKRVLDLVARNPDLLAKKRAACFNEARKYAIDTIVESFYGLYRELQAETGLHAIDSR